MTKCVFQVRMPPVVPAYSCAAEASDMAKAPVYSRFVEIGGRRVRACLSDFVQVTEKRCSCARQRNITGGP